jgi:hypothetical protein
MSTIRYPTFFKFILKTKTLSKSLLSHSETKEVFPQYLCFLQKHMFVFLTMFLREADDFRSNKSTGRHA